MPVKIFAKRIVPKLIPIGKIKPALVRELKKEGTRNRRSLSRTTSGWSDEKPTFKSTVTAERDEISVSTQPTGNKTGVDKFNYLNRGTDVRHAAMSPDFSPKTKPGRLISSGGSGGVMFVSRSFRGRAPSGESGIEARGWTTLIINKRQKPFEDNITKVIIQTAGFGK